MYNTPLECLLISTILIGFSGGLNAFALPSVALFWYYKMLLSSVLVWCWVSGNWFVLRWVFLAASASDFSKISTLLCRSLDHSKYVAFIVIIVVISTIFVVGVVYVILNAVTAVTFCRLSAAAWLLFYFYILNRAI